MKLLFFLTVVVFAALARKKTNHRPSFSLRSRQLHPKISYADVCDYNPPEVKLYNRTIDNTGPKPIFSAYVGILRHLTNITQTVTTIRRCNSKEDEYSCEHFHTWRFGRECCGLIEMKNQIWSELFEAVHPPLKCPIKKENYRVVNGSIDMKTINTIFSAYPIENFFWRVQVDIYDYKLIGCAMFGLYYVSS